VAKLWTRVQRNPLFLTHSLCIIRASLGPVNCIWIERRSRRGRHRGRADAICRHPPPTSTSTSNIRRTRQVGCDHVTGCPRHRRRRPTGDCRLDGSHWRTQSLAEPQACHTIRPIYQFNVLSYVIAVYLQHTNDSYLFCGCLAFECLLLLGKTDKKHPRDFPSRYQTCLLHFPPRHGVEPATC